MKWFLITIVLLISFLPFCSSSPEEKDSGLDSVDTMENEYDIIDSSEQAQKHPIGGPCTKNDDCIAPEGLSPMCQASILAFALPGGYCSAKCSGLGSCGTDAECIMLITEGLCVKRCSSNTDCRTEEGYKCDLIPMFESLGTFCYPET